LSRGLDILPTLFYTVTKPGMVFPVLLSMFITQTQPGIPQHVAGHPYTVMSENGSSTAFNTATNRDTEQ